MPQEKDMKHGAIPISGIRRYIHKKLRRIKTVRGMPFDWNKGFDIRDIVGSLPIKDQGTNSSCSGQSASIAIEISRRLQGIREGEISAKSFYGPIAYKGGGTTVSSLMTQFCVRGANLESNVRSYDAFNDPLNELMMEERSWYTKEAIIDAEGRAGYTPYDISEEIEAVAQTIRDFGFVIFEIWGQNGHNPGWTSYMPEPPSKNNPNEIWHHFMVCVGAKMIDGKKYIIAQQSMGKSWGKNGDQAFGEDYFNSGYIKDAFSFVFNTNNSPAVFDPFGIWAALKTYFLIKWKLIS